MKKFRAYKKIATFVLIFILAFAVFLPVYGRGVNTYFVSAACAHDYGTWIEEVPSTCLKEGTKGHYTCKKCGKHFDERHEELTSLTIRKKEHTMGYGLLKDYEPYVAPTCTEAGNVEYFICWNCDGKVDMSTWELVTDTVIPPTGHIDENDDGKCDVCGFVIEERSGCGAFFTLPLSLSTLCAVLLFGATKHVSKRKESEKLSRK